MTDNATNVDEVPLHYYADVGRQRLRRGRPDHQPVGTMSTAECIATNIAVEEAQRA